ncbi:lipid storage droplets surface-binding protein 2-like isoform X1 [Tenebrio molitor]|uniref:lipid storage droplets surface-binding protein 2-like isoform X1 n=1 Tax=Tenebrio molitor TaxID=7067 RepID=UPI0036249D2A
MADTQVSSASVPTCMESVNRIAKLPVVESSIQAAGTIYGKVKEFNGVTQWTCNTAENVMHKAVEVGKPIAVPIVQGLEGPIKKVDGVLCSGLDYVENKVPAVKLPPGEIICQMYNTTKDYYNNTVTPAVEAAYSYVEPTVKSAYEKIEPAVQTAKTVVEPAVEKAKTIVEPAVEMAKSIVEPACESIKQYANQKMDNFKHQCSRTHPEGDFECEECQEIAKKMAAEEH